MSDQKDYVSEIGKLITEMTGQKFFKGEMLKYFHELQDLVTELSETLEAERKAAIENGKEHMELLRKYEEMCSLNTAMQMRVDKYRKLIKEVLKTKREFDLKAAQTELRYAQNYNNKVDNLVSIMFKNPVYQEKFTESISGSDGNNYTNKTRTEVRDKAIV